MFKYVLILMMLPSAALAKSFSNEYIQFELPPGWKCILEGSEYVCQSNNADRKKEAIIILAAKKRGPQDDIPQYQAYLKQPKTYNLPGAKTQRSEPKFVETNNVNGQQWVDALHLASEVPGFYTRYLATTKADIGVAVTFSVTKSLYSAYKDMFEKVIQSMRVFRSAKTNNLQFAGNKAVGDKFDKDNVFIPDGDLLDPTQSAAKKRKKKDSGSGLIIVLVVLGGIGFALTKLKKKKGDSKKG
ncbi:MAG: hypothetical protein CME62_02145 [Halobacteriovoraceae bacterium]|nr:hypothetical protein [Halobacteriovoraceae bacterium]|tara:strand:+ start:1517 stop:2245 length:729 start_codon:yes stop_codon:yes gene_type:complete